jgi:hypothetical protein
VYAWRIKGRRVRVAGYRGNVYTFQDTGATCTRVRIQGRRVRVKGYRGRCVRVEGYRGRRVGVAGYRVGVYANQDYLENGHESGKCRM